MSFRYLSAALVIGILIIAAIIGVAMIQPAEITSSGGPVKFASDKDVREYLIQSDERATTGSYRMDGAIFAPSTKNALPEMAPIPSAAGAGVEYSTTNIQVEGVDEADFVKNDGRYIYLIAGGEFVIIEAYPPENARIISNTTVSGTPREMYLSGSFVAIFSDVTEEVFEPVEGSAAPVPVRREVTHAMIYDVTDRTNPVLIRTITASGTYASSRMTDGIVYLITQEYPQRRGSDIPLPMIMDGTDSKRPDIWRFDDLEGPFIFQTLTAFRPAAKSSVSAESYLVGYSSTFYASQENLFIAYHYYGNQQSYERSGSSTIIHRFELRKGDPVWRLSMSVPGRLLNQFSLDEYKNHLRVATTVEEYGQMGSVTSSRITILDQSGTITGEITGIAPTERIFSARFIGDRCYLVTFRQIDPFFVIDLSDPKSPKILGELKIPGYSDYLHPFDTNHIIGIGKDTEESSWGGVITTGVKVALFDVTNVRDPKLKDSVTIGGQGSDSEVLRDHKAFYLNTKNGVMVLPITVSAGYGSGYVWQGSYVYEVSSESGFTLRGTVAQYAGDAPPDPDRWPTAVRRSLSIGEVLATISDNSVVLTDIRSPSKRYATIDLPVYPRLGYNIGYFPTRAE
ncbi:MAG: beta-propeller domain-containing protein [Methanocalculus sp.]|uniref:beta-propeller domain-containing protein n=1 Tax=Methanocalculus sp. TaxID=2004547 RepID=UPI0027209EA2|nr:beta-propeller domain-containing protein [Methanocalculus sp.]MDO9538959.1 beta-propeller domain-containing protein [Methanocalculus sp.]